MMTTSISSNYSTRHGPYSNTDKTETKQQWLVPPAAGTVAVFLITRPSLLLGTVVGVGSYVFASYLGADKVGERIADWKAVKGDEKYPGPHTNRSIPMSTISDRSRCTLENGCVIFYDRRLFEARKEGVKRFFSSLDSLSKGFSQPGLS